MGRWPRPLPSSFTAIRNSASIRKLALSVSTKAIHIDMSLLKAVFPNTTSLVLNLNVETELSIFTDIFQFWPDLEELTVTGTLGPRLRESVDGKFCVIDEEEVEGLREKDEEYLQAVHIVSARPSLLTMPSEFK